MVARPSITIGITAFNAADTVERAVRSALAQTWRPIDIVVVDDGSGDDTPHILAALADAHSEIRTFRMDRNSGVAAARNRVLREARGEFVAFFDDDDESTPDRLDAQYRRIVDYEARFVPGAPVVCHAARRVRYPDGTERIQETMGRRVGQAAPAGPAVARRILIGTLSPCPPYRQRLKRPFDLGGEQ